MHLNGRCTLSCNNLSASVCICMHLCAFVRVCVQWRCSNHLQQRSILCSNEFPIHHHCCPRTTNPTSPSANQCNGSNIVPFFKEDQPIDHRHHYILQVSPALWMPPIKPWFPNQRIHSEHEGRNLPHFSNLVLNFIFGGKISKLSEF